MHILYARLRFVAGNPTPRARVTALCPSIFGEVMMMEVTVVLPFFPLPCSKSGAHTEPSSTFTSASLTPEKLPRRVMETRHKSVGENVPAVGRCEGGSVRRRGAGSVSERWIRRICTDRLWCSGASAVEPLQLRVMCALRPTWYGGLEWMKRPITREGKVFEEWDGENSGRAYPVCEFSQKKKEPDLPIWTLLGNAPIVIPQKHEHNITTSQSPQGILIFVTKWWEVLL